MAAISTEAIYIFGFLSCGCCRCDGCCRSRSFCCGCCPCLLSRFTDNAIIIAVGHELISGMVSVYRRDAVISCFSTSNASVSIVVVETQGGRYWGFRRFFCCFFCCCGRCCWGASPLCIRGTAQENRQYDCDDYDNQMFTHFVRLLAGLIRGTLKLLVKIR